jgi:hypothetical protein
MTRTWFCFLALAVGLTVAFSACSHGGTSADGGRGLDSGTAGDSGNCGACGPNQVCAGTTCVDLPAHCPCPKGAYCDLAVNQCKAGCLASTDCEAGYDCGSETRQCAPHVPKFIVENKTDLEVRTVWGSSPTNLYAADVFNLYHSDGSGTWTKVPLDNMYQDFSQIWGTSATNLYVGGQVSTGQTNYAVVFHYDGTSWTPENTPTLSDGALSWHAGTNFVWGSGPNDIYAADRNWSIIHSNGGGLWTIDRSAEEGHGGIWGSGPADIYTGGGTGLLHSNGGGQWSPVAGAPSLGAIWGTGKDDVYGLAYDGVYHSASGAAFTKQTLPVADGMLAALGGTGNDDVYAVGKKGTVLHSKGDGVWTSIASGTTDDLSCVWGAGPGDIYFCAGSETPMGNMVLVTGSVLHFH